MLLTHLELDLPDWLARRAMPAALATDEDRMRLVLDLASRNVSEATGGPFAAAIVERESGRLVSVGVNQVVRTNNALAHAEILAIGLADRALGTYDLGDPALPRMQLVSSSQMCAMCLGAVVWSGVTGVMFATTARDVITTIGFDEGPTPARYAGVLEQRGIHVVAGVLRDEGLAVLRAYVEAGGPVYNAHH
jgi:tRNA(Arg) A34 adenosine deaminase TadA